ILADTQNKGNRTSVMSYLHFMLDWEQFSIDFSEPLSIDYGKEWIENTPSFYRYTFDVEEAEDTFINMENFGKGIVLINGFNIGRFWEIGPTLSLYVSKNLLKSGENEIIVFETEGTWSETISLEKEAKYKKMEEK